MNLYTIYYTPSIILVKKSVTNPVVESAMYIVIPSYIPYAYFIRYFFRITDEYRLGEVHRIS